MRWLGDSSWRGFGAGKGLGFGKPNIPSVLEVYTSLAIRPHLQKGPCGPYEKIRVMNLHGSPGAMFLALVEQATLSYPVPCNKHHLRPAKARVGVDELRIPECQARRMACDLHVMPRKARLSKPPTASALSPAHHSSPKHSQA